MKISKETTTFIEKLPKAIKEHLFYIMDSNIYENNIQRYLDRAFKSFALESMGINIYDFSSQFDRTNTTDRLVEFGGGGFEELNTSDEHLTRKDMIGGGLMETNFPKWCEKIAKVSKKMITEYQKINKRTASEHSKIAPSRKAQ